MPNHTVSTNVDTMLRAADNAAIRTAIGLGTTDLPTFNGLTSTSVIISPSFKGGASSAGVKSLPAFKFSTAANPPGLNFDGTNFDFVEGNARWQRLNSSGVIIKDTSFFGFGTSIEASGADTMLFRDGAAGILAQRNGVNAQALRVYNTFPGTGNNEYAEIAWSGNIFSVRPAASGSGSIRESVFGSPSSNTYIDANIMYFRTSSSARWAINSAGGFLAVADNNYDIGASGGNRPRNVYVANAIIAGSIGGASGADLIFNGATVGAAWKLTPAGNIITQVDNTYDIGASGANRPKNIYAAGSLIAGASVQVGSGGNQLVFGGRGSISPFLDGVWAFYNSSSSDFGRICLGGGTSAFPAIKRNGTGIDIVLANDSTYAPLTARSLSLGVAVPTADLDIADTWNAPAIAVTGASGNGTTATITFATQATAIPVGSTIVVASINPAGYNGTFVVTASTVTSVSYLNATSAAWVSGGTIERVFTSVKLNVTDTASNAASNLMDLQVGGVSKLKINKAGDLVNPTWSLGALGGGHYGLMGSNNGAFLFLSSANQRGVWATNSPEGFVTQIYNSLLKIGGLGTDFTTLLTSDANGILAQRNGVNAQAFRVANSVGASPLVDYDRGVFDFKTTTNTLRIGTENGGTYTTARPIEFVTGGAVRMSIAATGLISTSASLIVNNTVACGAASNFEWNGRSTLSSSADGLIKIANYAGNDFGRLQLGGITSAFPAIKRNNAGIDIVYANDSGYAPLTAGTIGAAGEIVGRLGSYGTPTIRGGANNAYLWLGSTTAAFVASTGVTMFSMGGGFISVGDVSKIFTGTGSPEGVVTAAVSSIYLRTDGGASTTLYVKESSPTPTTGWVAK